MARKPEAKFEITAEDKSAAQLRTAQRNLSELTGAAKTATFALGSLVGAASIGQLVQITDRFNQLSTRIKTATRDTGDFTRVQQALLSASIATGTELETTVDTFQSLARVRDDLGATNEQMIVLTQVVQQLGVIGGTSSEALNNGLRQFNQAMAGGIFRAEEFNSIIENTPELARRIADGFGVTQGQLRQMVLEGRLFSNDVVNVLLEQAPEIAAQFEEIPNNLARSFTALSTAVGTAFSTLDQQIGATSYLADRIEDLAKRIAVISGSATPAIELELQLKDLESFKSSLAGELEKAAPGSEYFEAIKRELAEVSAQAEGTREALQFFTEANVGRVTGGPPAGDDGISKSTTDAARKRFEALIKEEERFLQQQGTLRIRGAQELARSIDEEESRLRAESLAIALGFEDVAAQERFARDQELWLAKQEYRAQQFEEELAIELGYKDARDRALQESEEAHQDKLLEIRTRQFGTFQKLAMELAKFEQKTAQQKTLFVLGQAQQLTAGLAQNSKTAFNINKAVSIAEAVINTATGVTAALRLGPKGIPLAALIGAQGLAQIATIQSTQFGGAATGLTSSGPGTGIPSLANDLFTAPTVTQEERNQSTIRLEIVAEDSDIARAIMKNVRIVADDEDGLLASRGSRQSLEFAT